MRSRTRPPGRGLRDRRFREAVSVYLVDLAAGVDAERVVAAFGDQVRADARGIGALAWPAARTVTDPAALDDLIARSVHRLPGVDDLAAIRAVVARGPGPLATSLTVLDDALALSVEHAAADGNEAIAWLTELLARAAGEAPADPLDVVRAPLVRAVAAAGPRPFVRYLRHRRRFVVPPAFMLPSRAPEERTDDAAFVRLPIAAAGLRALRGAASSTSTSAALIAVMAAALQAGSLGGGDPRVVIPIDVRRLAGGAVLGNFIATETSGSLMADRWDAKEVARVLRRQVDISLPQLLAATLRPLRPGRHGGTEVPELYVSLSVQRMHAGAVLRTGIASVGRTWPSATLAAAFIGGDGGASISFWDDSGAFDLGAVVAAVERLVGAAGAGAGRPE